MRAVRSRNTSSERKLQRLLRKIRVQYSTRTKGLPGTPDILLTRAGAAVFVHGCFWHGHDNCPRARLPSTNFAFWAAKIAGNRRRDRRAVAALRRLGYRVLTIWTCQLGKEQVVARRLKAASRKPLVRPSRWTPTSGGSRRDSSHLPREE